jgi:hypothetical protein
VVDGVEIPTAEVPVIAERLPSATHGLVLTGTYKGVKWSVPYEIDGRKGFSNPKVGLDVDGEEVEIVVGGKAGEDGRHTGDDLLRVVLAGLGAVRGETVVSVRVEARPPFERGRRVRYFLAGTAAQGGSSVWE